MPPVDVEQRTDARSTMPGIGGQQVSFGPPVGRLSVQGVADLLAKDPTTKFERGGLRGLTARLNDPGAGKDRALVEALQALPESQHSALPSNPVASAFARHARTLSSGDKVPLSRGQAAWLERLEQRVQDDPSTLSEDDVEGLVEAFASAEPRDRRFAQMLLAPVARHFDRAQERAELRAVIDQAAAVRRTKTIEDLALAVLAERIQEETPELRDDEARARAREHLTPVLAQIDEDRNRGVDEARRRLLDLDSGADPRSSVPVLSGVGDAHYRAGQARAERERAQEPENILDALGRS